MPCPHRFFLCPGTGCHGTDLLFFQPERCPFQPAELSCHRRADHCLGQTLFTGAVRNGAYRRLRRLSFARAQAGSYDGICRPRCHTLPAVPALAYPMSAHQRMVLLPCLCGTGRIPPALLFRQEPVFWGCVHRRLRRDHRTAACLRCTCFVKKTAATNLFVSCRFF